MTTAQPGSAKDGELRQRAAKSPPKPTSTDDAKAHSTRQLDRPPASIGLDVLRGLVGLLLLAVIGSYVVNSGETYTWYLSDPAKRPWFLSPAQVQRYFSGPLELTNDQLAAYDGSNGSPIYVALNRTIYDVSASPHVYGPGAHYSTLAAKDASRSYITTCFDPVEDLVPYFGGVEEVYVPLWLSRLSSRKLKPELNKIGKGDILAGKDAEDILDEIRKKVGRKNVKKLQAEAYEEAKERVKQQVQQWEGMFEKKNYPVVGKVVGVDEEDEKKWRHLGFCEAAQKLRPEMAESLQKAMTMQGRGDGKIALDMYGKPKSTDEGGDKPEKKSKKSKKQKKKVDTEGGTNEKANVRIEDMMKGGKYFTSPDGKKARKIEEIMKNGPKKGDGSEGWTKESIEEMLKARAEAGEDAEVEVPDAVPEQVISDDL